MPSIRPRTYLFAAIGGFALLLIILWIFWLSPMQQFKQTAKAIEQSQSEFSKKNDSLKRAIQNRIDEQLGRKSEE